MALPVCTICDEAQGAVIFTNLLVGSSSTACVDCMPVVITMLVEHYLGIDNETLLQIAAMTPAEIEDIIGSGKQVEEGEDEITNSDDDDDDDDDDNDTLNMPES